MYKNNALLFLIAIFCLSGCKAIVKAPQGSVPKRNKITTDAFGGWLTIYRHGVPAPLEGEFIAVGSGDVYIMRSNTLASISKASIDSARVIFYNTHATDFVGLTFAGSLLTLTNGYFLVITLPLTLITGITSVATETRRINFYKYPQEPWDNLRKFSRFPQGLPEGLNVADLKGRPNRK